MKINEKKLQNINHDFTYDLSMDSFEMALSKLREKSLEKDVLLVIPPVLDVAATNLLRNFYGDIGKYFPPYIHTKIIIKLLKNPESGVVWYLVTKDAIFKSSGDNG